MRRYDLLAIDLDGTLLDPRGKVSPANAAAVRRARDVGLKVVVCTGRGLVECTHCLEAIEQDDPVVVAGGSILACPRTRRTLHRFALDPALVARATERLLSHEHPVMILKDPSETGYDYLMVVGERRLALDPVTVWWLEQLRVEHRFATHIHEDEHPEHTVRLGVCGLSAALEEITADLSDSFGDQAYMHHFPAVIGPEHAPRLPEGQSLNILEVFARDASKWSAISWLAAREGIPAARIAAIGDQINDLPMVSRAGLGIAMDNAIPAVKSAASRQTRSNTEDGVAHAIDRILAGQW
jgi:hydroxymethylpyrimidine pyrophosphatase-like HAD family hydrolase